MVELVNALIGAAEERGIVAHATEPRAASARYDADDGRVVIDLTNGCSFAFPAHLTQGLETASDEQRAQIEILGAGYGLHWEALDVDLSVPGILAGILGTQSYVARGAGQTTSPAKASAARANGAKGGRPRNQAKG